MFLLVLELEWVVLIFLVKFVLDDVDKFFVICNDFLNFLLVFVWLLSIGWIEGVVIKVFGMKVRYFCYVEILEWLKMVRFELFWYFFVL